MRKPILLLLPVLAACGDAAAAHMSLIEDFSAHAIPLSCDTIDLGVEAAATEIRLAGDSAWTLLDGPGMALFTFSDQLRPIRRIPLPPRGPAAAPDPLSAALLGDSAVVVAARGQLRLVVLTTSGDLLHSIPLDFIPNSVEATSSGSVLVTPLPLGTRPPTLLMRHTAAGWDTLPVPRRVFEDMSVNALGNAALVEIFPDGSALVVHQFLSPRGFTVDPGGRVEPRSIPTPDGTRDQIDFVPRSPVTRDQIRKMLLPGMAMTIDPASSEVYLLTRSGDDLAGRPERAILRLSPRLEFLAGYTLPVPASSMVYLPRRRAALLVDGTDTFHLCPLPGARS